MMMSANVVSTERAGDELHRLAKSSRDILEMQRVTIARLAVLDQQISESRDMAIATISQSIGHTIVLGRLLLDRLILNAELGQQYAQLRSQGSESLTAEERKILGESSQDEEDAALENAARSFVSDCGRRLENVLKMLGETMAAGEVVVAGLLCEQARQLTNSLREIQEPWPWHDRQAKLESRKQYQRGELMDFETFKHELLKSAH